MKIDEKIYERIMNALSSGDKAETYLGTIADEVDQHPMLVIEEKDGTKFVEGLYADKPLAKNEAAKILIENFKEKVEIRCNVCRCKVLVELGSKSEEAICIDCIKYINEKILKDTNEAKARVKVEYKDNDPTTCEIKHHTLVQSEVVLQSKEDKTNWKEAYEHMSLFHTDEMYESAQKSMAFDELLKLVPSNIIQDAFIELRELKRDKEELD